MKTLPLNKDTKENKAIKEFVQALKSKYRGRVRRIILFGSYARGDYTEESDIDILIVGDVPLFACIISD